MSSYGDYDNNGIHFDYGLGEPGDEDERKRRIVAIIIIIILLLLAFFFVLWLMTSKSTEAYAPQISITDEYGDEWGAEGGTGGTGDDDDGGSGGGGGSGGDEDPDGGGTPGGGTGGGGSGSGYDLKIFFGGGGSNIVSPYGAGSYTFVFTNENPDEVTYDIYLSEACKYPIAMRYKLKRNGEYLISEYVSADECNCEGLTIAAGKKDTLVLEWYWDGDVDDEVDTAAGQEAVTYTLTITLTAYVERFDDM